MILAKYKIFISSGQTILFKNVLVGNEFKKKIKKKSSSKNLKMRVKKTHSQFIKRKLQDNISIRKNKFENKIDNLRNKDFSEIYDKKSFDDITITEPIEDHLNKLYNDLKMSVNCDNMTYLLSSLFILGNNDKYSSSVLSFVTRADVFRLFENMSSMHVLIPRIMDIILMITNSRSPDINKMVISSDQISSKLSQILSRKNYDMLSLVSLKILLDVVSTSPVLANTVFIGGFFQSFITILGEVDIHINQTNKKIFIMVVEILKRIFEVIPGIATPYKLEMVDKIFKKIDDQENSKFKQLVYDVLLEMVQVMTNDDYHLQTTIEKTFTNILNHFKDRYTDFSKDGQVRDVLCRMIKIYTNIFSLEDDFCSSYFGEDVIKFILIGLKHADQDIVKHALHCVSNLAMNDNVVIPANILDSSLVFLDKTKTFTSGVMVELSFVLTNCIHSINTSVIEYFDNIFAHNGSEFADMLSNLLINSNNYDIIKNIQESILVMLQDGNIDREIAKSLLFEELCEIYNSTQNKEICQAASDLIKLLDDDDSDDGADYIYCDDAMYYD